jgi:hypothetical protein
MTVNCTNLVCGEEATCDVEVLKFVNELIENGIVDAAAARFRFA